MTTYKVRLGGSPPDSADEYDSIGDAERAALMMAMDVAENDDCSQDEIGSIEIWGGPGDEIGWGACPRDDSGAYYPAIEECE